MREPEYSTMHRCYWRRRSAQRVLERASGIAERWTCGGRAPITTALRAASLVLARSRCCPALVARPGLGRSRAVSARFAHFHFALHPRRRWKVTCTLNTTPGLPTTHPSHDFSQYGRPRNTQPPAASADPRSLSQWIPPRSPSSSSRSPAFSAAPVRRLRMHSDGRDMRGIEF
jgi:hypothetical protein